MTFKHRMTLKIEDKKNNLAETVFLDNDKNRILLFMMQGKDDIQNIQLH